MYSLITDKILESNAGRRYKNTGLRKPGKVNIQAFTHLLDLSTPSYPSRTERNISHFSCSTHLFIPNYVHSYNAYQIFQILSSISYIIFCSQHFTPLQVSASYTVAPWQLHRGKNQHYHILTPSILSTHPQCCILHLVYSSFILCTTSLLYLLSAITCDLKT